MRGCREHPSWETLPPTEGRRRSQGGAAGRRRLAEGEDARRGWGRRSVARPEGLVCRPPQRGPRGERGEAAGRPGLRPVYQPPATTDGSVSRL
jgi:hypothetical protein